MAGEAVLRIRKLYDVETQAQGLPPAQRVALRQQYAKPIFDDLENWLKEKQGKISGKLPLGKAIRYARAGQRRGHISTTAFLNSIITQPSARCAR